MSRILSLPVIRELYARRLLFPVVLGLAVVVVLIVGAFEENETVSSLRPSQIDLPLPPLSVPTLRPSLEKSPLTYESDYWTQLAGIVRDKIILIGPHNRAGIMVAPGVAITSILAADEIEAGVPRVPDSDGVLTVVEDPELTTPAQRVLGVDAELQVALFGVKQPVGVGNFSPGDLMNLHPGAYVAVVTLSPEGNVRMVPGYVALMIPPVAGTDASLEITAAYPDTIETAAIVDLDGLLIGLALNSGGRRRVMAADAVMRMVDRLAKATACQAIEVADLGTEALEMLGLPQGVLVERVHAQAFLPEPSVQEGDILVRWNRGEIATAEEFGQIYAETEVGSLVRYAVIRDRKTVSGRTRMPGPDCRPVRVPPDYYPSLGVDLSWNGEGWRVRRVDPEGVGERAGLAPGALISGAGGRRFSGLDRTPFLAFEKNPGPLLLTVRQEGRVRMVTLSPATEENSPSQSHE